MAKKGLLLVASALLLGLAGFAAATGALSEPSIALTNLEGLKALPGKRTLVLYDRVDVKTSHQRFFDGLTSRGHTLTFHFAGDSSLSFSKYGVYNFDHVIIFSPTSQDLAGLSVPDILQFVGKGGNLFVAASADVSDSIRELANQMGVDFAPKGSYVIDHFNFDNTDAGQHTLVASATFTSEFPLVTSTVSPILYKGIGISTAASELAFDFLLGNPTSYAHNPSQPMTNGPFAAGHALGLVSGMQTKTNARAVFAGSLEMFSDKFFTSSLALSSGANSPVAGNEAFAKLLTSWAFQESHVLRTSNLDHHGENSLERPEAYRVEDIVTLSIKIEEFKQGQWVPYDGPHVEFEARMLDPYIRHSMDSDHKGNYSTVFKLPDVYGVYTLRVSHYRKGYSFVQVSDVIPVRPFRHTDYERFIPAAFPYYMSAFAMMASSFVFLFVFLYHRDVPSDKKKN